MGSVPKTAIVKLLNDNTVACSIDPDRFTKALTYVIRVYYGLVPENVEAETILGFRNTLFLKYPKLTFEQWNVIHLESTIKKIQGVSLTIDELMAPIVSYWPKIQFVLDKMGSVTRQHQEESEIEARKKQHKKESIELYLKCVNSDKVWTGTAFQANVFAKEMFAHRFPQPEKDSLYSQAKQLVKELEVKRNLALQDSIAFNEPVPDAVQMFSQLVVMEACKLGFEIIID